MARRRTKNSQRRDGKRRKDDNRRTRKNFAGFRIRLAAGIIDIAILLPFLAALTYLIGSEGYELIKVDDDFFGYLPQDNPSTVRMIDYIFYFISLGYLTYFISRKGQATIGKKITGIYVGNLDGSRLSLAKSLFRALVSILTVVTFGLGFLLVIFTSEKTALHDLICQTRVFKKRR